MNAVPGPRGSSDPSVGTVRTSAPTTTTPGPAGDAAVPSQRTAADVYRVSEDQVHRARMAVARNSVDSEDCRELLDMLGLMSEAGEAPPVRR